MGHPDETRHCTVLFNGRAPSGLASGLESAAGLEKRSSSMNLLMLGFSVITAAMVSSCWRPPSVPGSVVSQTIGTSDSLHFTRRKAVQCGMFASTQSTATLV